MARRRLYRSTDGRLVGGVAHGLATHLGVDPWLVRVAFGLLAVSGGAGIAAYAAFWALVPQCGSDGVRAGDPPGVVSEAERAADERAARLGPLAALCAVVAGAVLLLQRVGFGPSRVFATPFLVVGVGVAVLWRAADDAQRERWRRTATVSATGRRAWVRVVVGVTFVVVGAAAVLGQGGGIQAAVDGLVGGLVVAVGVAVVAGPWLLRTTRELTDERRERIRVQERAELAAHVHDSVVQTLTLIQRHADDPRAVVQLARAEERALRQWLYRPAGADPGMFRAALESAAADVEDAHGGAVEVVAVGDARVDEHLAALIQAAREAMVNAVKYAAAAGPVSVYAEVEATQASVFVKDRGPGFDLDAVPQDRLGVRQSIVGRMERHGGHAQIISAPGTGSEVRLVMPRAASPAEEAT
jgi:signal transduction histidine kinase/phage shock protein PspC (stress-responsive transcriptional regulator)